jgi:hypothetical protein
MALTESKEPLRLCPDCGSLSVEFSVLEGGDASCKACDWSGRKDGLFVLPVSHELGSNEEVLIGMYNGWREVFGKFASDITRFLLAWGFMSATEVDGKLKLDSKRMARYVSAAASASLASILEERQKIEKEKVDDARS